MDIRLRQIAGKPAGTYFIVRDNSASEEIISESKIRLIFINSQKGPVNCIINFAKGDKTGFETVYGKTSRILEKKGNYSLKTALEMLDAGPIAVMNLRKFEDIDKVGAAGINPNTIIVEEKEIPYTACFNTNNLWAISPSQICDKLTQKSLLNFANIGNSDVSIFVVVSKLYANLTSEGNESLKNCSLIIDEYPGLNFESLLKDSFVDVYVFNNTFDPTTVGTNKYYGHLFNSKGEIDLTNIDELAAISEAGFSRVVTGSLIPNLKNELDEDVSIDILLNQLFSETGLIAFINDDLLEQETPDLIDFDGGSYRKEDGTLKEDVSPYMLSHVVPEIISKSTINFPLKSEDDLNVVEAMNMIYGTEKVAENEFIGAMEQGLRVGDKIKGLNGNVVEIVGIEILENDVPIVPETPVESFSVAFEQPENATITVKKKEDNSPINTGDLVPKNTVITIGVVPENTHVFTKFVINDIDVMENPYDFTVTEKVLITTHLT